MGQARQHPTQLGDEAGAEAGPPRAALSRDMTRPTLDEMYYDFSERATNPQPP
jgi:hypothetical protein